MSHSAVPWRLIRRLFWKTRTTFWSRPGAPINLRVYTDIDTFREVLGRAHFTNAWEFSYDQGEDVNMRRPEYIADTYRWYQTHVRGYVRAGDVIDVACHLELEPTEYPHGHLHAKEYTVAPAVDTVEKLFEKAEITVDRLD